MKPKNKTKFCEQWLDLSKHASWTWLQKKKEDDFRACCTICKTDFDVSNMGICAITSHEKRKKHVRAVSNATGNCKSGQKHYADYQHQILQLRFTLQLHRPKTKHQM